MTSLEIPPQGPGSAQGKVVVITGGASGIGKAAAELFHSLGAKVVIGDLNTKLGAATAAAIGQGCTFHQTDVTSWSSLCSLFEVAVKGYGKVDIVLANAGVPEIEDVFKDELDDAGKLKEPKYVVMDIDLKGVLSTVKLAKHYFERQKTPGAIVLTSSVAGVMADCGIYIPVYTACKHALIGLTRSLQNPSHPFLAAGIRVNAIAPFLTESGFIDDNMRKGIEAAHLPINSAASVARAMAYLALTDGVSGDILFIADNEFTELDKKLTELQPSWLGEKPARWLTAKPVKHIIT